MIVAIERPTIDELKPKAGVLAVCSELQRLQRNRAAALKSRIMLENRLVAQVATCEGYFSGLEKDDREAAFEAARKLIERIEGGESHATLSGVVQSSRAGIDGFEFLVAGIEREMVKLVKQLPVAHWAEQPEQRGFAFKSLATIIGETGDLCNYAAPGKLWRRMGCAPYQSGPKNLMGATWRGGKEGKLSSAEWEDYGYCQRRRSVMYVIGDCLVKQNKSVYRERYDATKKLATEDHPDWKPLRCHRHAMLLTAKLLLKNLWIEWNGEGVTETEIAAAV